jgi:hypothetical protein
MTTFALYGTPFLRRYPGRTFVVTTRSDPPRFISGGSPPLIGSAGRRNIGTAARESCHSATESPCHVRVEERAAGPPPNRNRRVCMPASVSTFSARSSCQLMRIRPGTLMIAGAP